jgi:hypothetical protein
MKDIDLNRWELVEVESNKSYEDELEVYDIEVEDDHTFIANGFIVHNCPICTELEGKEWKTEWGTKRIEQAMELTNPEDMKKHMPWIGFDGGRASKAGWKPSEPVYPQGVKLYPQSGIQKGRAAGLFIKDPDSGKKTYFAGKDGKLKGTKELADLGIVSPPIHALCRCSIIESVDRIIKTITEKITIISNITNITDRELNYILATIKQIKLPEEGILTIKLGTEPAKVDFKTGKDKKGLYIKSRTRKLTGWKTYRQDDPIFKEYLRTMIEQGILPKPVIPTNAKTIVKLTSKSFNDKIQGVPVQYEGKTLKMSRISHDKYGLFIELEDVVIYKRFLPDKFNEIIRQIKKKIY